jgi:bis(5'-nucleosyl)-tetraphosphatase (symmetrical)
MHAEDGFVLVHAGLLPEWSVEKALALAAEVEARLRADDYRTFLARMYGDEPDHWDDALTGVDRLRVIVNAMTRLRVCGVGGALALDFKGEPGDVPRGLTPWFDMPGRRSAGHTIVFGHWSALGLVTRDDVVALDSGCVWGRSLSALRLEDRKLFQVPCPAKGKGREG